MEALRAIFFLISAMGVHGLKCQRNQTIQGERHHTTPICTMPQVTTSCRTSTNAWYYDTVRRCCKLIPLGNCVDGGNAFCTHHECKRMCQPIKGVQSSVCHVDIRRRCGEKYHAWHFDHRDKLCKMLIHAACNGKLLVFRSETRCQKVCLPHQQPQAICSGNVVLTQCSRKYPNKWYFSQVNETCLWISRDCVKGENSFPTYPVCMKRCSYDRHGSHYRPRPWQTIDELPK
ncbi:kunitz-type serine protease inhibitor bitisilin-3 [Rhipicephalus sanguineus]|uniref:kunitz-type serine protease inhibitor bitisilin-3 n=1 Tax=Rhipicephalus sanguineus TaxID=34632 RepID=UPI0018947AF6|nr:kunitz-type serine protease inhibitor bitisilin-3 [Rhipicephalus sanguineus]